MTEFERRIRAAFASRTPPGYTLTDHTHFFEAGFTSVILAAVRADLNDAGVSLGLVDMFRYPTLAALIEEAEEHMAEETGQPLRANRGAGRLPWQSLHTERDQ